MAAKQSTLKPQAKVNPKRVLKRLVASIWLFPIVLTVILLTLTSLKLHGSSMGDYYTYFYGGSSEDPALVAGVPRSIRSDEYLVATQMSLAQANNDFKVVNENIGEGSDMSVIVDVPYLEWSEIFKPHNFSFFVLGFEYAFAFKWWFMAYALALSVYFFTLAMLPKRRAIAALLAVAMVASPFIQWWYQYITLAPLYNILFASTLFVLLLRARSVPKKILLSIGIAYFSASFALVQYPAFQITIAIVGLAFVIGHLMYALRQDRSQRKTIWLNSAYAGAALVTALLLVGVFLYQKNDIVSTISNTTYPGARHIQSGGFTLSHFLGSNLAVQQQRNERAAFYSDPNGKLSNQSESSNFIFIFVFMLVPLAVLWLRKKDRLPSLDPRTIAAFIASMVLIAWLFIPGLSWLGSVTFLELVPLQRTLIGLGLANTIMIIMFIIEYEKVNRLSKKFIAVYSVSVLLVYMAIGAYVHSYIPDFISLKLALALAIPIPLAIYFLLQKKYILGLAIYAALCVISTAAVHPLYRGMNLYTSTPIVEAIKNTPNEENKRWVTEDLHLENYVYMSGEPSLTGIFPYPQLTLWSKVVDKPEDINRANRYSHVVFAFDQNKIQGDNEPGIPTPAGDIVSIFGEVCDPKFGKLGIGFIVTTAMYEVSETCLERIQTVEYPNKTFYIYSVSY